MANEYSSKGLTGKSTRKMVAPVATHMVGGVIHMNDLMHIDSTANDATKSGKQKGSTLIVGDGSVHALVFALGSAPDSHWAVSVDPSTVTPA